MEKRTDRRVRKTKAQLRAGLASLMKEKNVNDITVKELVEAVDINQLHLLSALYGYPQYAGIRRT